MVEDLIEEYRAAESPDYVTWGGSGSEYAPGLGAASSVSATGLSTGGPAGGYGLGADSARSVP